MDAGDAFVEAIKPLVKATRRSEVVADVGGFAGLHKLPQGYKDPVLVACNDGVGTKIELAKQTGQWEGIGVDCVAMCVNDLICSGAEPLFFLDYLASAKLDSKILTEIVRGIARACKEVGCTLLGGETAEMPGVYLPGSTDVAGFAVGVVERSKIIDGKKIQPGDTLIGIASSGFHSNGFSLIRKILENQKWSLSQMWEGKPLYDALLTPTRLYPPLVAAVKQEFSIHGIAHITGGGLWENTERILPENCTLQIEKGSWPIPPLLQHFRKAGDLSDDEFYRVFNAGIGLVLVISNTETDTILKWMKNRGENAYRIGTIKPGRAGREA